MRFIFIIMIAVLVSLEGRVQAISDQILLETSLTELAQNALDNMYGKGNFIIRARVAMTAAKYEVNYTKEAALKSNKKTTEKDNAQKLQQA